MENLIFNSIIFLGALGLLFGLGLGLAAKKFAVHLDPREEEILSILPGANCGACGFAGCGGYAESLTKGEAEPGKCPIINKDSNKKIASILGKDSSESERKIAVIFCGGGENCKDKIDYQGIKDCALALNFYGGNKECIYGCLGLGNCVRACPFGAITLEKEGSIPKIDPAKCTGCGKCVSACPKNVIKLVSCKYKYHILCSSKDRGADVRKICSTGCIGCSICVKICPKKDITLEDNLAVMNYGLCINCSVCLKKCPTKAIKKIEINSLVNS